MREPTILVPQSYFVKLSDWALEATGGNEPSAKLIAIFLYHYDNQYANRILIELVERAIKKHGKSLREINYWLPYSLAYMRELLLETSGQTQIVDAINILVNLEFINKDCPDEIREFYSKSHSWFRVETNNIQRWLNEVWFPGQNRLSVYHPQYIQVREAVEQITGKKKAEKGEPEIIPENEKQKITALYNFYRHIHHKNSSFILDNAREKLIRGRLKERTKHVGAEIAFAICCQAILGCVVSDFHQGVNDAGTVYDSIELIFRNGDKLERFIEYAQKAEITQKKALEEFKTFLSGKPSRYAKGVKKRAVKTSDGETSIDETDVETRQVYKAFAFAIAGYFKGTSDNKTILELCESNASLKEMSSDISDAEYLTENLIEASKIKHGEITENMKTQISDFSLTFCELQQLNKL